MTGRCMVCGREAVRPVVDFATGFTFCYEHFRLAIDKLDGYPKATRANWFRAIADAIDEVAGGGPGTEHE